MLKINFMSTDVVIPVPEKRLLSLLPFAVFLGIFIGTGIVLTLEGVDFAFYQLPASIAIIPAILVAIYLGKDSINEQVSQFISFKTSFKINYGFCLRYSNLRYSNLLYIFYMLTYYKIIITYIIIILDHQGP